MTYRGDYSSCTGTEYLVELACIVSVSNFLNVDASLFNYEALALAYLDSGLSCDSGKDRALKHRSYYLAVDNEEDIHSANFLDVLLLNTVEPENL